LERLGKEQIVTLPRRGYHFVGDVLVTPIPAPPPPSRAMQHRRQPLLRLASRAWPPRPRPRRDN
jgi:DNA-binding winged helix-turn-helix (wHTH) protein